MTSKRNWLVLIVLWFLLAFALLGCVRPMPGEDQGLVATQPPPEESESYPGPVQAESAEPAEEAYPAEEGYPVEEEQTELLQPESAAEGSEPYPGEESESAAGQTGEDAAAGTDQAAGEQPAAEDTTESEATEAQTPEAGSTDVQPAEGEAGQDTAAADAAAPEEEAAGEAAATGRTHTVAQGETLFGIGLQYGMSWVTLAQANGITNPDSLYPGQVLVIPDVESLEAAQNAETSAAETPTAEDQTAAETGADAAAAADTAAEQTTYIVQSGDTLYSISARFGVQMMDIARENELASFDQIYAGQELIIPEAAADTAAGQEEDAGAGADQAEEVTHVVEEGETVFTIAFNYGITWTELVEANDIASPYTLETGQTLVIPAGE